MDDSWYELVEGQELEQGDLIEQCPVYVAEYTTDVIDDVNGGKAPSYKVSEDEYRYNAVIMTQSCDLEQRKVRYVVLCGYWSLEGITKSDDKIRPKKMQEKIRQNNMPNYHMLDACELEDMRRGIQIINFRETFTVPYDFLTQFAAA